MKTNHFLSLVAVFVLAFIIFCVTGCPTRAHKEDMSYSEIVNVPGASKEDLYAKADLWFIDAFRGPKPELPFPMAIPKKSAIITADRDNGIIRANYTFLTDMLEATYVFQIWFVYSDVELQVSDGQYRLIFSNPINGAATYSGNATGQAIQTGWIYSSTAPLFSKYVLATKKVWHDLALNLRETVGGTSEGK